MTAYVSCTKCKTEKPARDFYRNPSRATGYNAWCKECARQEEQERRKTPQGLAARLYSTAKQRAKKMNLEFDLTIEWIVEQMETGKCVRTGAPFSYELNHPNKPSLDRRDNDQGYIKSNVDVVAWFFNDMKGQYTDEQCRLFATAWG